MNMLDTLLHKINVMYFDTDGLFRSLRMGQFSPDDPRIQELKEVLRGIKSEVIHEKAYSKLLINQIWFIVPLLVELKPRVAEWSSEHKSEYNGFVSSVQELVGQIFGFPTKLEYKENALHFVEE